MATPLLGKHVLVTRAAHQAQEFASALRSRGAEPILAPIVAIEPPSDVRAAHRAVDQRQAYAWIVFTSRNGVDAFFERLAAIGGDAGSIAKVKVAAIGTKTRACLEKHGVRADLSPADFVSEEIARALVAAATVGDRVLIYGAQGARDVLARMLAAAGLEPTSVAAYRTTTAHVPAFDEKVARADVLTFTSASTVRAFSELLGGTASALESARGKTVACIGPVTATAARDAGLRVDVVAGTFTTGGLIEALEAHFATLS